MRNSWIFADRQSPGERRVFSRNCTWKNAIFKNNDYRYFVCKSLCAPLCCKNMCCESCFWTVEGSLRQQIQEFARSAMKANARPGAHTGAPGWSSGGGASPAPRTRKPGQSAHQGVFPGVNNVLWAGVGTKKPKSVNLPSFLSGPQKGPAERDHGKKRQKVSQRYSTLFDIFRAGQKVKDRQKVSKYVRQFSIGFARHQFSGPFWGALIFLSKFGHILPDFCSCFALCVGCWVGGGVCAPGISMILIQREFRLTGLNRARDSRRCRVWIEVSIKGKQEMKTRQTRGKMVNLKKDDTLRHTEGEVGESRSFGNHCSQTFIRGSLYTRENGYHLAFFPLFYSMFCFKTGHFPFKTVCSVLGAWKGHFGPEKDKWWIWCSKT